MLSTTQPLQEMRLPLAPKLEAHFQLTGGYSTGKNLELIPGKRIVQTWRAADWPEGVGSTATFDFEQQGDNAVIRFTQTNVPDDYLDAIEQGWVDYYWEPMRTYLSL
jgi:activator of HSP90 ATPase